MSGPKTVVLPQKKSADAAVEEQGSVPANPNCQMIRELAYHKWEAAGCPCGDGVEFWLEAEAELS